MDAVTTKKVADGQQGLDDPIDSTTPTSNPSSLASNQPFLDELRKLRPPNSTPTEEQLRRAAQHNRLLEEAVIIENPAPSSD